MDGRFRRFTWLTGLPRLWTLRWFPTQFPSVTLSAPRSNLFAHGLLLSVIAGALFFTRLSCPLLEPEEARYAEIPRQMLAEGRSVEPVLHGEPYYQKPPLLYWLVMLSYRLFGVHDWAARLIPCLASFATVFVIWIWGRQAMGPRAGLAGAVLLALSGRFIYLGRMLTLDPLLTLCVTAALATGHLAVRQQQLQWRLWIISALCCGLGLLTKGPVALVLTIAPILAFQMLDQRSSRPHLWPIVCFVTLAIALAAPWYLAMAWASPEAAADFFWIHHVRRFLDPVDHEEPVWFFLPSLLAGTLPWSLLLIPLGRWLLRKPSGEAPSPALGFALLSLACCVLFFSASGCKRAVYILPALPWLAASLGFCLATAPWREWGWRLHPRIGYLFTGLVFVVLFVAVYELLPRYHRQFSLRGQLRRHLDNSGEVVCFPKRWDSVSFYLQRDDVRVFRADQTWELQQALQGKSNVLLCVKSRALPELPRDWPIRLTEIGRQSARLIVLGSNERYK